MKIQHNITPGPRHYLKERNELLDQLELGVEVKARVHRMEIVVLQDQGFYARVQSHRHHLRIVASN